MSRYWYPLTYQRIFTLLRETGLWADEVLGLNVGDVQLGPSRAGLHLQRRNSMRVQARSLRLVCALVLVAIGIGSLVSGSSPARGAPHSQTDWTLIWSDEFNGLDIDTANWDGLWMTSSTTP